MALDIATLKVDFLSSDWTVSEPALDTLIALATPEVLDFLLPLLEQPDVLVCNRACIALHEIGDSRAVEPLMQAIGKKENEGSRGSMVYALEYLDCRHLLSELFDLLFYGDTEVQMGAKRILDQQQFEFSAADLHLIQAKWESRREQRLPDAEAFTTEEEIQECVAGYLAYLTK